MAAFIFLQKSKAVISTPNRTLSYTLGLLHTNTLPRTHARSLSLSFVRIISLTYSLSLSLHAKQLHTHVISHTPTLAVLSSLSLFLSLTHTLKLTPAHLSSLDLLGKQALSLLLSITKHYHPTMTKLFIYPPDYNRFSNWDVVMEAELTIAHIQ